MKYDYDAVIEKLKSARTLRCSELSYLLRKLGFFIKEGKSPNYKVCIYPVLSIMQL